MDETSGVPFTMPVAPAYGGSGFGGGFGFGGDWSWILLLILLCGGGWGGLGFGGGLGMMGMMDGGFGLYPWMNNSQNINDGFRDQALSANIASIGDRVTSGFGDIQTALCGGFAGVNAAITNSEINAMQNTFGLQTALQNCCCENRASIADLKYTLASEACATRAANTANTQAILDKMCQQEIDNLKSQNVALQNQVNMLNLAASQTAQTSALIADNTAQTQYIVNRVAPYPVPAYVVANPVTPAV